MTEMEKITQLILEAIDLLIGKNFPVPAEEVIKRYPEDSGTFLG